MHVFEVADVVDQSVLQRPGWRFHPTTVVDRGAGHAACMIYSAGAEVNQLQWSSTQPDWIAISYSNRLQILRV